MSWVEWVLAGGRKMPTEMPPDELMAFANFLLALQQAPRADLEWLANRIDFNGGFSPELLAAARAVKALTDPFRPPVASKF